MTITLDDLKNIKNECDTLSKVIKEVIGSYQIDNSKRKLFVSRRDYEESLKLKNQIPQDYYFYRCFDCFVQIVYNKMSKMYQIYLDGFYSHVLDKFKRVKNSDKSFEISEDFDKCFEVFHEIIQDIHNNKILQNGLF